MMLHDHQTCSQPIPTLPVPSRAMVAWARFDNAACNVLRGLGLLRAWYAVARLALTACPPLARLVAPLRPVVLVPSLTGGEVIPLRDGRLMTRGMVFGGDTHASDVCSVSAVGVLLAPPRIRTRVRRSVVMDGRCIHTVVVGWRAVRGGR